jgi:hypothetical protein
MFQIISMKLKLKLRLNPLRMIDAGKNVVAAHVDMCVNFFARAMAVK